jgi:hypothetical protein
VRVYLPSTLSGLRALLETGELTASGGAGAALPAYAVTPALREWYAEGDDEELEYAALTLAARASVRLLDPLLVADPDTPARRVVVVAEVDQVQPAPAIALEGHGDRAAVQVLAPVPLRLVKAVHVDDPAAADDVRAAAESVTAADMGSEDAAFVVEQAEGHELQWYGTQEIGPLLELS